MPGTTAKRLRVRVARAGAWLLLGLVVIGWATIVLRAGLASTRGKVVLVAGVAAAGAVAWRRRGHREFDDTIGGVTVLIPGLAGTETTWGGPFRAWIDVDAERLGPGYLLRVRLSATQGGEGSRPRVLWSSWTQATIARGHDMRAREAARASGEPAFVATWTLPAEDPARLRRAAQGELRWWIAVEIRERHGGPRMDLGPHWTGRFDVGETLLPTGTRRTS